MLLVETAPKQNTVPLQFVGWSLVGILAAIGVGYFPARFKPVMTGESGALPLQF